MAREVIIYPKSDFAGIINKKGTYSKQTYSDNSQILIGKEGDSIGRAYLSYDLSAIPKNAKINRAVLTMQSWYDVKPQFYNPNIRIALSFQTINYENQWDFLKIPSPYDLVSSFSLGINEILNHSPSVNDWLYQAIKNNFGGKLNLMINHLYENSSFLKLNGVKDYLSLTINYTVDDGGGTVDPKPDPEPEIPIVGHLTLSKATVFSQTSAFLVEYTSSGKVGTPKWEYSFYSKDNTGYFELISEEHTETGGSALFIHTVDEGKSIGTSIKISSDLKGVQEDSVSLSFPRNIVSEKQEVQVGDIVTFTCPVSVNETMARWFTWKGDNSLEFISNTNSLGTFVSTAYFRVTGNNNSFRPIVSLTYKHPIGQKNSWGIHDKWLNLTVTDNNLEIIPSPLLFLTHATINNSDRTMHIAYRGKEDYFYNVFWSYDTTVYKLKSQLHKNGEGEGVFQINPTNKQSQLVRLVGQHNFPSTHYTGKKEIWGEVEVPVAVKMQANKIKMRDGEIVEYRILNLPKGASVTWTSANGLSKISSNNESAKFKAVRTNYGRVKVTAFIKLKPYWVATLAYVSLVDESVTITW